MEKGRSVICLKGKRWRCNAVEHQLVIDVGSSYDRDKRQREHNSTEDM